MYSERARQDSLPSKRTLKLSLLSIAMLGLVLGSPGRAGAPAGQESNLPETAPRSGEPQRRIEFVRLFETEKDVGRRPSFWRRLADWVAGPAPLSRLVRPYGVATDSTGRVLVTDPGLLALHVFDFEARKYQRLDRAAKERFRSPIGVAVDGQDNIYVTDSILGKIFVFDRSGKFRRFLGESRGEGIFRRPTGIAIDAARNRLYLTDTLDHKVFLLDLNGQVLGRFGGRGTEPGKFNFPTHLAIRGEELVVVDAMNFRVQIFSRSGEFRGTLGKLGGFSGSFQRPKGIAADSEGNLYVAEALFETIQVFNDQGRLLYYFGGSGNESGRLQLPAGLWIDARDYIYVADSYNRRVQIFRFVIEPRRARWGQMGKGSAQMSGAP